MQPGVKPEHKKLMSVLAYLGILIIIPFLMAKDDPSVHFHIKQGSILVAAEIVVWVLSMTMFGWSMWPILQLINLACIIFSIIGIVNVLQGHDKELPLIGSLGASMPV